MRLSYDVLFDGGSDLFRGLFYTLVSHQCPTKMLRTSQEYTMLRVLASPMLDFASSPGLSLEVDHLGYRG